MSGFGEAASIAGLITISGQCVKQISNLYSFARDFQNVLPQTRSLLNELEGIQQCLSQVESVASKALTANSCDVSTSVDALFKTVDQCQGVITAMEGQLKAVYTGKKKMVWNRLKIAAAKDSFARFQAQIAAQKQDLLLQLETLSCDLDLQTHNSMERFTASSSSVEKKLSDMTRNLDRHHDLSGRQLQCLNARLEAIQKVLARSISTNHRNSQKSRTKVAKSKCSDYMFQRAGALKFSRTQTSNQRPATQLLRVVSPALLMYEKGALLQKKIVPLVCSELDGIDDATKIQMIKYLQGLRLLIWLLKHNNSLTKNLSELGITSRSSFSMQAAMIHSLEFSTALQGLIYGPEPFKSWYGASLVNSDCSPSALMLYVLCNWLRLRRKHAAELGSISRLVRHFYRDGTLGPVIITRYFFESSMGARLILPCHYPR